MRIGKVTVLAALTILLAGVVDAAAHRSNIGTNVRINSAARTAEGTGIYSGVVRGNRACRKGRRVQVWHDSDPPFLIGTATTDSSGAWQVEGPAPPDGDSIYAVAKRKKLRSGRRHKHKCTAETSAKKVFPVN